MQSLYRVIKNSSVENQGPKEIVTEFEDKAEKQKKEWTETNAKNFIDSYETLAKSMVENARTKSDEIMSKAYNEIEKIEADAHNKGFAVGYKEGRELGYKEAYDECYTQNIERALKEAEDIKNNADNMIKNSVYQGEEYLKNKEDEIKNLIIDALQNILRREVKDADGMNSIIFHALSVMKNTESFIIKARSIYCTDITNNIEVWRKQLPFKGDIFIVEDDMQEEGTVIVERDSGKTIFSMDIALEKLKEILYCTG